LESPTKTTIHYIGDVQNFTRSKLSSARYAGMWEAVRAHIRYISRPDEAAAVAGLDPEVWRERVEATKGKQAAATKCVIALPNDLSPSQALVFVQRFFVQHALFLRRSQKKGHKTSDHVVLPQNHIGIAIHDSYGLSGRVNRHAHLLIWPRDDQGRTISLGRPELKALHAKWRDYLEASGYRIREDTPDLKGIHYGPERIRKDPATRQAYGRRVEHMVVRDLIRNESKVEDQMARLPKDLVDRVKALDLVAVAGRLGLSLRKEGPGYRCHATWRGDRHPSVRLYRVDGRWLWHDHGTGDGGSLIDLVMRCQGLDFRSAVEWLAGDHSSSPSPPGSPESGGEGKKAGVEITQTYERPSQSVVRALWTHRRLTWEDLERFRAQVVRVRFVSGKEATKIAFAVVGGGYELKDVQPGGVSLTVPPKGISVADPGRPEVLVAESVYDALAADRLCPGTPRTLVSLNSTALAPRAVEYIRGQKGVRRVALALDADEAGQRAAQVIEDGLSDLHIDIQTLRWLGYCVDAKDPSDAWVQRCKSAPSRAPKTSPHGPAR
jgi:hypothetical protein